jgi:hypothetical protein
VARSKQGWPWKNVALVVSALAALVTAIGGVVGALVNDPRPALAAPAAPPAPSRALRLAAAEQSLDVVSGTTLAPGLDMGVSSSSGRTDWLRVEGDHLLLAYPAGEQWGAVFVTVGKPRPPPRPSRDLSAFESLVLELRGARGGEVVEIGIKSDSQPDDGSETKVPITLTPAWERHALPLAGFAGARRDRLYVVVELVFSGGSARTVLARKVQYLAAGARASTP